MISVTLRIDGADKTFRPKFLSGMAVRKAFDISKMFESGEEITGESLDQAVDYICLVFENQFTREDYYNGISIEKTMNTTIDLINEIVNLATGQIKKPSPTSHNKKKQHK